MPSSRDQAAEPGAVTRRWLDVSMALALVAGTFALYAPVRSFDFVGIDDPLYVSENARVAAGLTPDGIRWAFSTWHGGLWIPLTWLSYMLDVQLWGASPGGHHLTNVGLHAANAVVLFLLLLRLTGAPWRSALVAALFAWHPLHVESVAWITERKDVLSTVFMLLALSAYVGFVRKPHWGRYAVVGVLFALSLMAKPMMVTLPFVLLLLDVWPLRRVTIGARRRDGSTATESTFWRVPPPLVWEKVPLLALSLVVSIVTYLAQRHVAAVGTFESYPLGLRLQNALVSYAAYLLKTLWPARLSAIYGFPESLPAWQVMSAAVLLVALSMLFLRVISRRPEFAVGWFWYLGTLLPVIGLVQVGVQGMADRFTYVPLIGLFVIAAWAGPQRLAAGAAGRIALGVTTACLIAACAMVTRGQVAYWKDNVTLWTRITQVTLGASAFDAHVSLGATLRDQGRFDEAARHFVAALEIDPRSATALAGLGLVAQRQGNDAEALARYEAALRIDRALPEVQNNLGVLLAKQGRLTEASEHFANAVRLKPEFEMALVNLGLALMRTARHEEAVAAFRRALRINPANQVARDALVKLGGVP